MKQYDIAGLDIEMQRLFALAQEKEHLGLREMQAMASRQAAELLQGDRRGLEVLAYTAQYRQADRQHLQRRAMFQMRGITDKIVRLTALHQTISVKSCQRDTKARFKVPENGVPLRLRHECWPRRIPRNRCGGGRGASTAPCMRHIAALSSDGDLGYEEIQA